MWSSGATVKAWEVEVGVWGGVSECYSDAHEGLGGGGRCVCGESVTAAADACGWVVRQCRLPHEGVARGDMRLFRCFFDLGAWLVQGVRYWVWGMVWGMVWVEGIGPGGRGAAPVPGSVV